MSSVPLSVAIVGDNPFARALASACETAEPRISARLEPAASLAELAAGAAAPALTVYLPTIHPTESWTSTPVTPVRALQADFDSTVTACFRHARARAAQYLRQRRGRFVFCTPQPSSNDSFEPAERLVLAQSRRIGAEALYALSKVIALEFATKDIRASFADVEEGATPASLVALLPWLASDESRYSVGVRLQIRTAS